MLRHMLLMPARMAILLVAVALVLVSTCAARADIFRWDNGELISGTEGITLAPGVQLHDQFLEFADLANKTLTDASFARSDLTSATFQGSTLTRAVFSDATIRSANFSDTTSGGFTKEQLYSTANYVAGDLTGLRLRYNNLAGWDFSDQNLETTSFLESDLTGADFSNARISNAFLQEAILKDADFTGAQINMASFWKTTQNGFVKEQLHSTSSYQQDNLQRIDLGGNDLSGWDFGGKNLAASSLSHSNLEGANLSGANLAGGSIWGASLTGATSHGLTKEQFYSTESYLGRFLVETELGDNDLSGWDFQRQNLRFSSFRNSDLTDANFFRADVNSGDLRGARLSNANFSRAILSGADLTGVDAIGAVFADANLSFADARGALNLDTAGVADLENAILPNGSINNFDLTAGETLVAYPQVSIPVVVSGGFSIAPTARFDLTDNAAIIDAVSASAVRTQLIAGRGEPGLGGAWTGNGITSSTTAAANAVEPGLRSLGYAENGSLPLGPYNEFHSNPVEAESVLIAFTRTGDVNLDGVVNDDDVTIVGATYAPGVPNPHWALGDFDYNGFVDDDDVTLLGAFYDPSATPIGAAPGANNGDSTAVAAVPEPTSWTLFICAALAMILRAGYRARENSRCALAANFLR